MSPMLLCSLYSAAFSLKLMPMYQRTAPASRQRHICRDLNWNSIWKHLQMCWLQFAQISFPDFFSILFYVQNFKKSICKQSDMPKTGYGLAVWTRPLWIAGLQRGARFVLLLMRVRSGLLCTGGEVGRKEGMRRVGEYRERETHTHTVMLRVQGEKMRKQPKVKMIKRYWRNLLWLLGHTKPAFF